jgi:hypothetical protein
MQEHASSLVEIGFVVMPVLIVGLMLWAVRHASPGRFGVSCAVAVAWLALWAGLAGAGLLARFDLRPPPFALALASMLIAGVWLGLSPLAGQIARAVPLWALVLAQGFRLPLELLMHRAALEHVMPNALSFSGYNFDIVTGASAFLVAYALRRGTAPALAWVWSCYGSLCLVAIAVIAIASSPMIAAFGPNELNTWVTHFPFVWLPSVLVVCALAGHLVVFRKLALIAQLSPSMRSRASG